MGFFFLFSLLALIATLVGIFRFWADLKAGLELPFKPVRGLLSSIGTVLKRILLHQDFGECTAARSRQVSHLAVFFGKVYTLVVV